MAGVLGCLHVLSTTSQDETSAQFIDMARKACEAQEELINDILDVYKAESGGLELNRVVFKPSELRGPVLDQLAGAAAERNLTLRIELPDTPLLHGDVRKLIRVLINLVNNAIKFTRKGGITVDTAQSADPESLVFRVRDTGVGIAPDAVPHVFDRFFQAQQPGARRGSGLGLNFCKVVVQAHGGRIWAESEHGFGTTIVFSLPFAKGSPDGKMARTDRG